MAEIINLRRVRKRLARDAAASEAAAARAKHGQTSAERQAAAHQADATCRTLDNARLAPPLCRDRKPAE